MKRAFGSVASVGVGLLLFLAAPSNAVTIFDTIGPTGVTTGGAGVFVGTTGSTNYERAASFTLSSSGDYILTGIDLLLDSGGADVTLWSDAAGQPGTVLDSATAPSTAVVNDLFSVDFSGGAVLSAGQTYWISVSLPSGSTAWRYTSTGPYLTGARMYRQNGGPWQDSSPRIGELYGFTVLGTPVPEPGTLPLLGFAAGLGVLGEARRRSQRSALPRW